MLHTSNSTLTTSKTLTVPGIYKAKFQERRFIVISLDKTKLGIIKCGHKSWMFLSAL